MFFLAARHADAQRPSLLFRRSRYLCASFLIFTLFLSAANFLPKTVQAVTVVGGYQASVISLDYPRELPPGTVGQVTVQFQNIGTTPWLKDGKNFVSLYRWDPRSKKELASAFARPSWETTKRPTRIPLPRVNPGASVDLAFPIVASSKPGIYREEFVLAAENLAWIAYSPFVIELRVGSSSVASPSTLNQATVPLMTDFQTLITSGPIASGKYAATLLLRSAQSIKVVGERVQK